VRSAVLTVLAAASHQRFLACLYPAFSIVVGQRLQHTQLKRFVELVELVEVFCYPPAAM
jgi:hypothetical protein